MNAPPKWFKPVAVVALLWNLLGCFAIATDLSLSASDIAALPPAQQGLYAARPGWAVVASVVAVVAGALGCIGLLLRKKWSFPVLAASLLGIIVQDFNLFVLSSGAELAGSVVVITQALVLAVGIGLLLFSRRGVKAGWLA
jgi:hypothetical protein